MFDWLFRSNKAEYVPHYSALRETPTRGRPPDLIQQEQSPAFSARCEALQHALLDTEQRPQANIPLFTELIDTDGNFVSLPLPEHRSPCIPVFSTPFRAADYRRTLLKRNPRLQYLCTSPVQFIPMLRDFENAGIEWVALDRCPRCSALSIIGTSSIKGPDNAIEIWAITQAAKLARTELYYTHALASARAGRLELARDVGLEAVGHVTMEDPRLHLLLGQVAIGLGDGVMLKEAKAFLDYFNNASWRVQLDQSEKSKVIDYAGPEEL